MSAPAAFFTYLGTLDGTLDLAHHQGHFDGPHLHHLAQALQGGAMWERTVPMLGSPLAPLSLGCCWCLQLPGTKPVANCSHFVPTCFFFQEHSSSQPSDKPHLSLTSYQRHLCSKKHWIDNARIMYMYKHYWDHNKCPQIPLTFSLECLTDYPCKTQNHHP